TLGNDTQEYFPLETSPDVLALFDDTIRALASPPLSSQTPRIEVVPVSLPHTRHALPAYYVISCAEASSNLARYDGMRFGGDNHGDMPQSSPSQSPLQSPLQ